ncbi:hypothetical protein LNV81_27815, partial [Klebsiella pneumoniae]|nr:hypothetical protein [Klebsiella pneumoniae]
AQIREILISESAWEEMTCLFAPSLILSLMEKLSPLSDPLLYGSIVKTPEGKNLYMVVPMSIIARLTILFVL